MDLFWILFVLIQLNYSLGWRVVLKVTTGQSIEPATSIYDLWTSNVRLNDDPAGIANIKEFYKNTDFPSYKSRIINEWSQRKVENVRVAMYGDSVDEVLSITFNASIYTDDKLSWFSAENIVASSFDDLRLSNIGNCSLRGYTDIGRRFFIYQYNRTLPEVTTTPIPPTTVSTENATHEPVIYRNKTETKEIFNTNETCDGIRGWMGVVDSDHRGDCHWEYGSKTAKFLYSPGPSNSQFVSMSTASVFVVFVDDCADHDNPCQNGGQCINNMGNAVCRCQNQTFGERCQATCPCDGICLEVPVGDISVNSETFSLEGHTIACKCRPGYEGKHCKTDTNECASQPCANGGVCHDLVNRFSCQCKDGFRGDTCADVVAIKESSTGAIVALSICIPLIIVVIVAIVAYIVYIKRNPEGYGRHIKRVAMARGFVRRSLRRLSGRKPKRQRPSADHEISLDKTQIVGDEMASPGQVNPAFEDYDRAGDHDYPVTNQTRRDIEHIDLSADHQAVITERSSPYGKPMAYIAPSMGNSRENPSPRPDSERSFPNSRESNTSGSLYEDQFGFTPSYDAPTPRPRKPKNLDVSSDDRYKTDHRLPPSGSRPNAPDVIPGDRYYQERKVSGGDRFPSRSQEHIRSPGPQPYDNYRREERSPSYENTEFSPRSPSDSGEPRTPGSSSYRPSSTSSSYDRYQGPTTPNRSQYNEPTSRGPEYTPTPGDRYGGAPLSSRGYEPHSPNDYYDGQYSQDHIELEGQEISREVEI